MELHSRCGDKLPSDDEIRSFLIKKGFNPRTVGDVIKTYRATLDFVNEEANSRFPLSGFEGDNGEPETFVRDLPLLKSRGYEVPSPQRQWGTVEPLDTESKRMPMLIPVVPNEFAALQADFTWTEEKWSRMMAVLEVMKPGLVGAEVRIDHGDCDQRQTLQEHEGF